MPNMTDKTTLETDMIDENNNRQQQLEQWLQQVFLDQTFSLDSLPADIIVSNYQRQTIAPTSIISSWTPLTSKMRCCSLSVWLS